MTRHTVWSVLAAGLLALVSVGPTAAQAESELGVQPLHREFSAALASLPPQTQLLLKSESIERFLTALDGHPPDWPTVYGQGHHDPGHDERLFALNRERDAGRVGKDALHWMIAFVWLGSCLVLIKKQEGFTWRSGRSSRTGWGDVRFKHEDLPATLIALAGGETTDLRTRQQQGERIEIEVLMAGRLIEEESLVYDFSHEAEGQGLIMPVVRIEALAFVLAEGVDQRP